MATYYVHCIIKKPNHYDPHTSIQEYGVSTDVSSKYATERWSQAKMIEVLEGPEHNVRCYGTNPRTGAKEYVDLEVIRRHDGVKYVKTKNDGDKPDNLLEQRDCEVSDRR